MLHMHTLFSFLTLTPVKPEVLPLQHKTLFRQSTDCMQAGMCGILDDCFARSIYIKPCTHAHRIYARVIHTYNHAHMGTCHRIFPVPSCEIPYAHILTCSLMVACICTWIHTVELRMTVTYMLHSHQQAYNAGNVTWGHVSC
jgi:hypothetical protein